MSRNIIISVLGTGFYEECNYFFNEESSSHKSRFIQESTYHLLNEKNFRIDKVIVLLTAQAKKENWLVESGERNNFRENKMMPYTGLKTIFESQNIPYQKVDIPDGSNQDEIWQIFDAVFDTIKDGDKVHLDITHSLRYLPMLLMVLVNYTRLFRKNVSFASITYGNYEQRSKETNKAPLMDITPLLTLQDWASAADKFISYGDSSEVKRLADNHVNPIRRESRGTNTDAANIATLNRYLEAHLLDIKTCRAIDIMDGKNAQVVGDSISRIKDTLIQPFDPVFALIKEEIEPFLSEDKIERQLAAVKWCVKNDYVQQGITMLYELIVTVTCVICNISYNDSSRREVISSLFAVIGMKIEEEAWKDVLKNNMETVNAVLANPQHVVLQEHYFNLTELRNDINHAGLRVNYAGAGVFKNALVKGYEAVYDVYMSNFKSIS